MNKSIYINPFDLECEEYAKKFDKAMDDKFWQVVRQLIHEVELFLQINDTISYTPLYYSLGTAYGDLAFHCSDEFTDKNKEKSLFYYRKCFESLQKEELQEQEYQPYILGLKLNLLTNYGNTFDYCDRKLAAIRMYREALKICPDFMMAKGNLGVAFLHYSMLLHDSSHRDYLNYFAYGYLKEAVNDKTGNVYVNAKKWFNSAMKKYDPEYIQCVLEVPLEIPEYDLGDEEETDYRKWCLSNHLFLNPLNDLPLEHSCFAADVLELPPVVTDAKQEEIPIYFGLFNQIKQEFIYARYLIYVGKTYRSEPHYSDKETYLVNLYDYPQYSSRIEGIKLAFRSLYSLFDRVAFFISRYWDLGLKERDISFSNIWKSHMGKGKKEYALKNILSPKDNYGLNSIWWIYKDFKEKFGKSSKPKSQKLNVLRNALEHKYVKVHDSVLFNIDEPYVDEELTYHISEDDLYNYTLELMILVRELIIDLVLAVHVEEMRRKEKFDNRKVLHIELDNYDDKWKI